MGGLGISADESSGDRGVYLPPPGDRLVVYTKGHGWSHRGISRALAGGLPRGYIGVVSGSRVAPCTRVSFLNLRRKRVFVTV